MFVSSRAEIAGLAGYHAGGGLGGGMGLSTSGIGVEGGMNHCLLWIL